jgi:hypothetical protein
MLSLGESSQVKKKLVFVLRDFNRATENLDAIKRDVRSKMEEIFS